jgi:hypothetical protein
MGTICGGALQLAKARKCRQKSATLGSRKWQVQHPVTFQCKTITEKLAIIMRWKVTTNNDNLFKTILIKSHYARQKNLPKPL